MEFDVAVWRGSRSDGSIRCAAVCPAIAHVHARGQGDTEDEALVDAAGAIAVFAEKMFGRVKTGQAAKNVLSEEIAELTANDAAR